MKLERKLRRVYLDAKVLAASSEVIIKWSAALLFTNVTSTLLTADERMQIRRGKFTRETIDNLKNTVPAFTVLRDVDASSTLRHIQSRLNDAKTTWQRNSYRPYFYASSEVQMETSKRVARAKLAEGLREWRDTKSKIFKWK